VIDKENGHYGSCINAALPVAKGKYVKVLDADDWFDPEGFGYLVDKLQSLDNDLVITNYTKRYVSESTQIRYCSHDYMVGCDVLTSFSSMLPNLSMHAVAYRMKLLRKMNYKQSEGVHHSDVEWFFCPLFFVKTLAFVNADVYQHFLARVGQSSDPAVFKKNLSHRQVVALRILEYYFTVNRDSLSKQTDAYLFRLMKEFIASIYKSYLWQSDNDFVPNTLESFDQAIREINEPFYNSLLEEVVHRWIPIHYIRYWRTHSKRFPIQCILKTIKQIADLIRFHKTYV
jgi:glycosyltransferase involved in cell wall biosynthesis